jgi:hypothetical protein
MRFLSLPTKKAFDRAFITTKDAASKLGGQASMLRFRSAHGKFVEIGGTVVNLNGVLKTRDKTQSRC